MKTVATNKKVKGMVLSLMAILLLGSFGCSDDSTSGAPGANAGADQKVLIGDKVALDGQASTGVSSAAWTIVSQPSGSKATLSDAAWLTPTFTADEAGDYVIELAINGGAKTDTVTITSKYVIAVISNGSGSSIKTRERFGTEEMVVDLKKTSAILTAKESRGEVKTYAWEQISGPSGAATSGATAVNYPFTAPDWVDFLTSDSDKFKWQPLVVSKDDTDMLFRLTVADSKGHSDTATGHVYLEDAGTEIMRSSGLLNVGVKNTVYLSGPSLKAKSSVQSAFVTSWSWTLTRPSGSSAKFINSGNTTSTLEFPKFIPDVAGIYTVAYSSVSPNGNDTGTLLINASTFVGVGTIEGSSPLNPQCGTCHNGGAEPDKVTEWSKTKHASIFKNNYESFLGSSFNSASLMYQTVGYNPLAANGGFDDVLKTSDVSNSSAIPTFAKFANEHPDLANLSNVQCENCHGPGGGHSGDPLKIAKSFSQAGMCGQCHAQKNQWINSLHNMTGVTDGSGSDQASWKTNTPCLRCHSTQGFVTYLEDGTFVPVSETGGFVGVSCVGCHDPHDATNPDQLRAYGKVKMAIDGSIVNAGKAAVCYTCHDGIYNYKQLNCDTDADGVGDGLCAGKFEVATQYRSQVHYNPQSTVLEGNGAITDLDGAGVNANAAFTLTENSFHGTSGFTLANATGDLTQPTENNKCVTCHMGAGPSIDEAGYNQLGGHAFTLRSHTVDHVHGEEPKIGEVAKPSDLEDVASCKPCHLTMTKFNRDARADYDGDGTREGIQDEVKGLLLSLSAKLNGVDAVTTDPLNLKQEDLSALDCTTWVRVGTHIDTCADNETFNQIIPASFSWAGASLPSGKNCTSNLPVGHTADEYSACNFMQAPAELKAAVYNHNLMVRDSSLGIHNTAFTVQVLQKTYTAISKMYPTAGPVGTENKTFAQAFPLATLR